MAAHNSGADERRPNPQRCAWVDLEAVAANIAQYRRVCGPGVRIMAVLKALSYGTDLIRLGREVARLGIDHVGVSSTKEGVAARQSGVTGDIYVFLPDHGDAKDLLTHRLIPFLCSEDLVDAYIAALAGSGRMLDAHLKVDTGMHRLGVTPEAVLPIAERIRRSGVLRLTGLCTHFAAAEAPQDDDRTRAQIRVFDAALAALRQSGHVGLVAHAANSAATARFAEARYDMVRIGIGLYGVHPSDAVRDALELRLALGVTSVVASVLNLEAGEALGYNWITTVARRTRVGIVPFGYADGFPWSLSGLGHVLVCGRTAPILGRISMDQMEIDLTDIAEAGVGSDVLLYGAHGGQVIRPEDVAVAAGTMSYELLVRIGPRVERMFVGR